MRDRTDSIASQIKDLAEDERVLAAVALSLPGTGAAQLSGAALAADGTPSVAGDDQLAKSRDRAATAGIRAGTQFFLTLTTKRVRLHRRSAFGRLKEVVFDALLGEVKEIKISKQGHAVVVHLVDGREIRLETPKAFKFLPDVYARLPELLTSAKTTS